MRIRPLTAEEYELALIIGGKYVWKGSFIRAALHLTSAYWGYQKGCTCIYVYALWCIYLDLAYCMPAWCNLHTTRAHTGGLSVKLCPDALFT